ncbi:MAG: flavodoxin domain-containing protein [Proteobacteria bacterium]|nr:flavodoxin domain-containing protein [Pseudomonadota bacterium]MBU4581700.1 flavodoxin domain-containing protein [Pseudomonadota bacterium]MCG2739795.1 flavodoxin domain-containing protein [Syntrophaceae bacterium]
MKNTLKAVPVTEDVWWVGAIDWNIRDFHGYQTRRGSTYNAYLVVADKVALIDTVKAPFREEMMARIASVIDPGKIDYIVSNHSEMDHSGALPEVIAAVNPEKVFASAVGAKTLKELFPIDREITAVKDGESLSLGNRTLTFMETRMLHWPDSMFSYLNEEELLFSQDAFGMHYASLERFADECDPAVLSYEAATYYANILLPYSPLVRKLIEKVTAAGLSFRIIAPDHGPIWRKETGGIIGSYAKWAAQKPEAKAVVVYATMWRSTEKMARAISEGLAAGGLQVKLMEMGAVHRSDVAYELLGASVLAVGSSTLNNQLLPNVADVLTYLKGLKPKNLLGAAFGSYGWSGEAVKQIEEVLAEMRVDKAGEGIRVKNVPDAGLLSRCYELGKTTAEKVHDPVKSFKSRENGAAS